ncbi:hypothetical protein CY34DRAFT_200418 [Suillus luteus UH-Slu-Lm8-n1]|uniref:Uncharacterized protein n=1 Tax=Suillus luteus UH-Slu-Lm8-n1 TaxID=930992 RepID=A0A0D0B508_9AGAM|nr:hypothetical protein CY34DRAFT_200418 [Suillus luteus UH-Slu-Lm8-n1]
MKFERTATTAGSSTFNSMNIVARFTLGGHIILSIVLASLTRSRDSSGNVTAVIDRSIGHSLCASSHQTMTYIVTRMRKILQG